MIPGLSAQEAQQLLRSIGTHRTGRVLSPLEVGRALAKALASGATRAELATQLQVGSTQLAAFLNLTRLTDEVGQLAEWGGSSHSGVAFSSAALLAVLPPNDQCVAATAILEHQLSWKEVVQLTQISVRSRRAISACISDVLRLRPKVERRYVFLGALKGDNLLTQIGAVSPVDRDRFAHTAVAEVIRRKDGFHVHLGTTRFSIVSSFDIVKASGFTADALEAAVGENLAKRLRHEHSD
ncbi:MAG TPA: hypothetical protein DCM67_08560 [Propionibacteriaceae bacterium]|nr:hypothetical protein [Propionibacteriaceae bacterium]